MTPDTTSGQQQAVIRLTALWALNECGLGGLMFALHIPLTGIFVGGFAVVLIGLIAWYSRFSYKSLARATVLVLIVKATVSPHAPPPAYLAVAFQGLLGALLYSSIRNFTIASLLLAVLALAESALQKIIVLTLIYGNSLWHALNKLFESIVHDLSLPASVTFSYLVIGLYVLGHMLWGLWVGRYTASLPARILKYTDEVLQFYKVQQPAAEMVSLAPGPRRRRRRLLYLALLLVLLAAVLLWKDRQHPYEVVLYVILRSLAMVALLFFVIRPLLQWLILRWLRSRDGATQQQAAALIGMLPGLRRFIRPAWQWARAGRSWSAFILCLVILSLHEET